MEAKRESDVGFDLDYWTLEKTLLTQDLNPGCKMSEDGTITQEFEPCRGNGDPQRDGLTMDILETGLKGRKVNCIVILLRTRMLAVSTLWLIFGSQESFYGTLGFKEAF